MPQWTIRALMEWTEQHFQQKGLESPRLETQLLLSHALGCKKTALYTRWDEIVDEERRGRFRDLIKRRLDGAPIQHLIGYREFFLLDFEVTPDVLIPRPETELLVTEALNRLKTLPMARVLDVGTGSGCIAISIAHRIKPAQVTATEISAPAIAVAKRNAKRHGVADRVRFVEGDLLAPFSSADRFDVIVANPPYVSDVEFEKLPPHVRDFEPRLALKAGPEGFDVYDRLIPAAVKHLEPDGCLLLEIGFAQEEGVRQRMANAGFDLSSTVRDDQRHPRVVAGKKK
jgi:release factor glutamine methyltransferase